MKIARIMILPLLCVLVAGNCFGQKNRLHKYVLGASGDSSSVPVSNSVSQMELDGSELWIGTDNGLGKTTNGGLSWLSYLNVSKFANPGIFSLATNADTIWTSTGYDSPVSGGGTVQTGSGYTFSFNDGTTWNALPQTLDHPGDSIYYYSALDDSVWILPVTVPEENVTFDISLSPGTVWIASWSSGLRKSTDNGTTWQRILLPPDNSYSIAPNDSLFTVSGSSRVFTHFDPRENNNFLAFSVLALDNDTIWCGTAGGINKSTDGGVSWSRFTHETEAQPILGNWVIHIDRQVFKDRIWCTNWIANDPTENYGVSYTEDGGVTWKTLLQGIKTYTFAFKDSIVYIGSDNGIFRTSDGGATFSNFATITDPRSQQSIPSVVAYAITVKGDSVFVGTGDGTASTLDNASNPFGKEWTIYRSYQPASATPANTYAYPNPFSPAQEIVRIHYKVTGAGSEPVDLDIFDFAMARVRTVTHQAIRAGDEEHDEIWDGKTDAGKLAANGVYFYRVKIGNADPLYGKILVLQ
jgi:photosystem II stability/assembly factor-like uncharacterized protein